jgi:hypothetical protein
MHKSDRTALLPQPPAEVLRPIDVRMFAVEFVRFAVADPGRLDLIVKEPEVVELPAARDLRLPSTLVAAHTCKSGGATWSHVSQILLMGAHAQVAPPVVQTNVEPL